MRILATGGAWVPRLVVLGVAVACAEGGAAGSLELRAEQTRAHRRTGYPPTALGPPAGLADRPEAGAPAPTSSSAAPAPAVAASSVTSTPREDPDPVAAKNATRTALEQDHGLGRRVDEGLALVSIAAETIVREAPRPTARRIGYLRAGARVTRSPQPAGHEGCAGGWYSISPAGFVCVGATASLDPNHPVARSLVTRPDRTAGLPYGYGLSRSPAPPLYVKVPTPREQRSVEPWLGPGRPVAPGWQDVELGPVPAFLQGGARSHSLHGYRHAAVFLGRALPRSGFALVGYFEAEGRSFGISTRLEVLPLDGLRRVEGSRFHGAEIPAPGLPVAFTRHRGSQWYTGHPERGGVRPGRPLAARELVALSGMRRTVSGVVWLETRDGGWVREEGLTVVSGRARAPGWARPGVKWVEVDLLRQVLVAWEGDRAVYVTLVSTGAGAGGKEERLTPKGQFRIHTKHVTATMSGEEVGDEYELGDVPWVQYFSGGYALHAAYWHDVFGAPRSHGCVNLSPIDARWLFHWTDPPVPSDWHGAIAREGTLVWVH